MSRPVPDPGIGMLTGGELDELALNPDDAVFLPPRLFLWGGHPSDDRRIPWCEVDFAPLERAIAAGGVTCSRFGVGNEIEGVPVGYFGHLMLSVGDVFVWFTDAPEGWVEAAITDGYGVRFPQRPDGDYTYLVTGKMTFQFGATGLALPSGRDVGAVAASRGKAPVGRNDPCPCGSGVKFKRCHGR